MLCFCSGHISISKFMMTICCIEHAKRRVWTMGNFEWVMIMLTCRVLPFYYSWLTLVVVNTCFMFCNYQLPWIILFFSSWSILYVDIWRYKDDNCSALHIHLHQHAYLYVATILSWSMWPFHICEWSWSITGDLLFI